MVVFQAEGGIRNLVRSRGLGDVYKRQEPASARQGLQQRLRDSLARIEQPLQALRQVATGAVSYTHLTLPTSDRV